LTGVSILHVATNPFSRDGTFRQIGQARLEARQREIKEGAQFDWQAGKELPT
jgi:hypothetical protein